MPFFIKNKIVYSPSGLGVTKKEIYLIRKHKKISKGIEWHHALFETRKSRLIKYALTDIEKSKSFHLREIDRLRLDITLEKL